MRRLLSLVAVFALGLPAYVRNGGELRSRRRTKVVQLPPVPAPPGRSASGMGSRPGLTPRPGLAGILELKADAWR